MWNFKGQLNYEVTRVKIKTAEYWRYLFISCENKTNESKTINGDYYNI